MGEERWLGAIGLVAFAALIWFGAHERRQADTLQERLDAMQVHVSDMEDKASAVDAANDDLKNQMDRFDSEDWRDVMPEAKDAANNMSDASDGLQQSVAEAADES